MKKISFSIFFCFTLASTLYGQTSKVLLELREGDEFMPAGASGKWEYDSKEYRISLIDLDWNNTFEEGGKDVLSIGDYSTEQRVSIPLKKGRLFNIYENTFVIVDFSKQGDFISIKKYPDNVAAEGLFDTIPDISHLISLSGTYGQLLDDIQQNRYQHYYFNFWTPSCRPCLEDAKYLFDFEEFQTKVINICGDCEVEKAKEVLEKYSMPGYHFVGERLELRRYNWVPCYPSSAVYDQSGKLEWIGISEPFHSLNKIFMDRVSNETASVLFIGNSFLRNGEIVGCFKELCERHHRKMQIDSSVFNGVFLKDQLTRALDPDQPYPLISPETGEDPLAVKLLKSQRWDYVAVIPPGRDKDAFAQLRALAGGSTSIAFLKGFSRIIWSSERREEQLRETADFAREVADAFDMKVIDNGGAFEWFLDHCIHDCMPFDASGHFTPCGNKIIGCLVYQTFFGDITFSDVKAIFGEDNSNAAECLFDFIY